MLNYVVINDVCQEPTEVGKFIDNCKIELRLNSAVFHSKRDGTIYTQEISLAH